MVEDSSDADPGGVPVGVLAERLKERIYADLTILAVTLGLALSGTSATGGVALTIAGTAVGLWLATIVADLQAHRVACGGADFRR